MAGGDLFAGNQFIDGGVGWDGADFNAKAGARFATAVRAVYSAGGGGVGVCGEGLAWLVHKNHHFVPRALRKTSADSVWFRPCRLAAHPLGAALFQLAAPPVPDGVVLLFFC